MMFSPLRLGSLHYEISRFGSRKGLGSNFCSTMTNRSYRFSRAVEGSMDKLYHRISPVGDPNVSIVPILDQWIEEGRSVDKHQLTVFIKQLRRYKRYSHALQISMWMTDNRWYPLTSSDVATRLDLMSKVQGIEQAEKYFNSIPQKFRGTEVYGALLNCYACAKSVEKAEAIMQKMRDLGFARMLLQYNVMLNLYYKTGNIEKAETLLHEMRDNGIVHNQFTLNIQLSAFAAVSDIEGIEKIVTRMDSDPKVVFDWTTYSVAANGYAKAGLVDKALEMLKKSEALVTSKQRSTAYCFLLTQYAVIGKKDEALRLWELYKKKEKVYNKGYISILTSLLKLDDFEMAESVFDEWESQPLKYDIFIPNFLIGAYSRKGLLEKAETLLERAISRGGQPNARTWYYLATGYLQNDQPQKAVEMMKKAVVLRGCRLKLSTESLAACLEYLKAEGDTQRVEEFIKLLLDSDTISLKIKENLLDNIKAGRQYSTEVTNS